MKTLTLSSLVGAAALALTTVASAGPIWHYDAGNNYTSLSSSPFAAVESGASGAWVEDFEDGLVNSQGLSTIRGGVRGPDNRGFTDSVDGDDGSIDGSGSSGHSYLTYRASGGLTFKFDADALGGAPTYAGLVWTDGNPNAIVTFEAFDTDGNLIGTMTKQLGNADTGMGETAEDRFLGVEFEGGISMIRISSTFGGIEVDHVQYGYAVVPLPAPVALGAAGLAGVAVLRRRKLNRERA